MNRTQQQLNRQLFANKPIETQIDKDRITLYKLIEASKEEEKTDDKLKKVINPNLFREQVRRQQRDFHQQNHQFLKMSGIVARSSRDDNKFNYIGDNYSKKNTFTKGNTNSKNIQRKVPTVHLSLDTVQFSCALAADKVPIKDLYQMFPFKKQSILFQSHQFLNPEYIFFLQQNRREAADILKNKLSNTADEGVFAEFKATINRTFKHVTFFDYLYFLNPKVKAQKEVNYPNYINEIAMSNTTFLSRIEEDERDKFNYEAIQVSEQDTCERLIIGEETDVGDSGENLCFDTIQDYSEYKKQKAIDFKFQKIFEKQAVVNTNIRNIISTEKIYLVEIIEEVKSYILLSKQCEGTTIMDKVYEHLTAKADEYLRLLCGYTQSKILTIYNIENYQEKIYEFIQKSIRFKKEIRNIPQWVIKQYPVLQIWFKIPENLLGYSREQLHECFYQLMEAIIEFQNKMKNSRMYEQLKIKRAGIKYVLK